MHCDIYLYIFYIYIFIWNINVNFFSASLFYKTCSSFICGGFTTTEIWNPVSRGMVFLDPYALNTIPPVHLSFYLPPWVGWKNWLHLVLLPFLLTFLSHHFLQAQLEESQESQLRPLKLRTSCALRNFCLKTKFTFGIVLTTFRFCII